MTKPNACANCQTSIPANLFYCPKCLNNWLEMRKKIQDRLQTTLGDATTWTVTQLKSTEMTRLSNLWKRDRDAFVLEARTWY